MSFILDALKKSETDRQQQGGSDFANIPSSSEAPGAPRWLWALGLLLAVNLAVLLVVLLRDDAPQGDTPPAQVSAAPRPSDEEPSFSERIREARDREPAAKSVTAVSPGPAATTSNATPSEPTDRTSAGTPAGAATEAGVEAPPAARPRPQPDYTLAALPTADELVANGNLQMPPLHLDIHVYSTNPAERFVFINMVRHREKSRLAEGPVVHEITPEGVILDYSGTRFLLPRE
jgi:general secretion pathway protein B